MENKQVTSQPEPQPVSSAHETASDTPNSSYTNSMYTGGGAGAAGVGAAGVGAAGVGAAGVGAMTAAYANSGPLTQYQPINSYQTSSTAGVYGGSALYTAYQPTPQAKQPPKDTQQYDNAVVSSNSLTSTSTTQTSTAKVVTTTTHNSSAGAGAGAGAGYAAGALYGAAGAYATYDEAQLMRQQLPHHMGGYYEVGYGGAREGAFGIGAGERFGRTDAASPQQVSAGLPPGYAYFFQTIPTAYQYGVYPAESGGGDGRSAATKPASSKANYTQSYWAPN